MNVQRHVVLMGPMGSGKSTIGRQLADRLELELVDNDEVLEQRVGVDAATYAEVHGRDALHVIEAAILIDALRAAGPSVITAAASTIEDARCRQALADLAVAVWLHGDVAVLAARARDGAHRPLGDDIEAELERLGRRRDPLYDEAADLAVDVSSVDDSVAVEHIVEYLAAARDTSQMGA